MHTEIEAKFLDINHDTMRAKLTELGARCVQPERLMRRKNYNLPKSSFNNTGRSWVRIRDEGDKITMSYKQLDDRGIHGTKEVNLTIDSFEAADAFLQALGLEPKTYQETKRESWVLGDTEIELDQWPWIRPFLEIEGKDEQTVRDVAAKLGLEWEKAVHGSVEIAYRAEYDASDEDINTIPVITFESPVPDDLKTKQKKVLA